MGHRVTRNNVVVFMKYILIYEGMVIIEVFYK